MFHVTERLLLRPAWPEDAEAIFGGIADEGVVRNLASAPWPYSREDAQTFVLRAQRDSYPRFLITSQSRLVGCIGIDQNGDSGPGAAELGYWIARPYWGRGFATEATRAIEFSSDGGVREEAAGGDRGDARCDRNCPAVGARPPVRRPFRGQSGIGARAAKGRVQADRPDRKAP